MKKTARVLSLLLCALLLLSLCACKTTDPTPDTPDTPVTPDDPTPDTPVTPTPDDPAPEVPQAVVCKDGTLKKTVADDAGNDLLSIDLTVPLPENMPEAQQYYQDWLNDTAYYCELDAEDAASMRETALQLGNVFIPYTYESSYELLRNDGKLLSVWRTYYTNLGGPHPNTTRLAETFVAETGARLVLDDVFSVPEAEYMPQLVALLLPMMDEQEKTYGETVYFDGVRDSLAEHYDKQNFALTEDSLRVFFPTYAIAPYAAGEQIFDLPLSELADILNPAWTD